MCLVVIRRATVMNDELSQAAETPTTDAPIEESLLTLSEREDLEAAESQTRRVLYAGQDFDVDGLVRRLRNEDIKIPQFGHNDPDIESAGFQRGFVWTKSQMDRFIESLLLGFPIPGVFFVRQRDRRYLVLDGQQRLVTLGAFYEGIYKGREFSLSNVSDDLKGVTYKTLTAEQRRTLDNSFIQATIVDTDGSPESLDAVYQIFERLNSGGTQLTPHEIRVALYAGPLVDLLEELNRSSDWRQLYGARSVRVRDQELILRIIALFLDSGSYSKPLKAFLNKFAGHFRDAREPEISAAAELFRRASHALLVGPGPGALRKASRQVNAAQAEAVYVGLMHRLAHGDVSPEAVASAVASLRENAEFDAATTRATADEEPVSVRLREATEAFAAIP